MFCTSCGKEIKDGALFCTHCGAKVKNPVNVNKSANPPETPNIMPPDNPILPQPPKKKTNPLAIIIPLIIIVVLLAGGGIYIVKGGFAFGNGKKSETASVKDEDSSESHTQKDKKEDREKEDKKADKKEADDKALREEKTGGLMSKNSGPLEDYYISELLPDHGAIWQGSDDIRFILGGNNYDQCREAYINWQDLGSGIISHIIADMDNDGTDEMLVTSFKDTSIVLTRYELRDDMVKKGEESYLAYYPSIGDCEYNLSYIEADGNTYILLNYWYSGGVFADGYYAALNLYDPYLRIVASVSQNGEGSDGFVYTAYKYGETGDVTNKKIIYDQYGEDEGKTYHFSDSVNELFEEYSIKTTAKGDGYPKFGDNKKFLASQDNVIEMVYLGLNVDSEYLGEDRGYATECVTKRIVKSDDSLPSELSSYAIRREDVDYRDDYYAGSSPENGIYFPYSSYDIIPEYDLRNLSKEELRYARNEIYARKGYIFKDDALRDYYRRYDWYQERVAPKDFSDNMFNKTELDNINAIKAEEARR